MLMNRSLNGYDPIAAVPVDKSNDINVRVGAMGEANVPHLEIADLTRYGIIST